MQDKWKEYGPQLTASVRSFKLKEGQGGTSYRAWALQGL